MNSGNINIPTLSQLYPNFLSKVMFTTEDPLCISDQMKESLSRFIGSKTNKNK